MLAQCETLACLDALKADGAELREENRLTSLLKQSINNGKLLFFLEQLSEIGSFFTAHLTLSDGTLVLRGTVVEKRSPNMTCVGIINW